MVVSCSFTFGEANYNSLPCCSKIAHERSTRPSLNENIDTTTAVGELAFHMIGSIVQFERRLISERTKAGLEAARARGRRGGRKAKLNKSDVKKAQAMLLDPMMTKAEVAKHFDVSRPTLNKALSECAK